MPIQVICPGCHARFQVSDKFAGRTGACPKCKAMIRVPTKDEEVTVHAPEDFGRGGRDTKGTLVLKPITRIETKVVPLVVAAIVGAIALVAAGAWWGGTIFRESLAARAVALLVLSPALVVAAYTFLRDQDLEPHRGRVLAIRSGLCAAAYTALWGVFAYSSGLVVTEDAWSWLLIAPPFIVTGGLVALATLDLDFGGGALHYSFYIVATVLLRWCAGMGWIWEIGTR
ncbi:MAG: hypothetical protein JW809_05775 [Pirellulales bacterium]|nr:hypothetical protein [Pirellulales bacterium]